MKYFSMFSGRRIWREFNNNPKYKTQQNMEICMNSLYPSLSTCKKIENLFETTEMCFMGEDPYPMAITNFCLREDKILAPNISELLERLPEDVPSENGDWHLKISRTLKNQYAAYYCIDKTFAHGEYLPEALGQLLIKLDEEKLL